MHWCKVAIFTCACSEQIVYFCQSVEIYQYTEVQLIGMVELYDYAACVRIILCIIEALLQIPHNPMSCT